MSIHMCLHTWGHQVSLLHGLRHQPAAICCVVVGQSGAGLEKRLVHLPAPTLSADALGRPPDMTNTTYDQWQEALTTVS